ncbi:MAG: ABC transporter permease [Clostridia bacterium]|nr:ABC transporter permease [Clostridia bacterium]
MKGSSSVGTVLNMGIYVIGIFAVIFLFYTNSFLLKRRKKEIGLYNILGMEKKHIARIMTIENIYSYLINMISGIFFGILFSRLMLLLLIKILRAGTGFVFNISLQGIYITLIFFTIISVLILLNNIRQIHLSKPIELLKGGNVGEKEPKSKWIIAAAGILTMGTGYFMAITVSNAVSALNYFFIAVILVIIGTYCLFTAGSIVLLKILRRNKKYYYKTNHFTSVSGMIYRMKQNAVGLANICILSTMVLVMLSSTVCLYIGQDNVLKNRFPTNIGINTIFSNKEESESVSNAVKKIVQDSGYKIEAYNEFRYKVYTLEFNKEEKTFLPSTDITLNIDKMYLAYFFPIESYITQTGSDVVLNDEDVLIYSPDEIDISDKFLIQDLNFHVKGMVENPGFTIQTSGSYMKLVYIFVKDEEIISQIHNQFGDYYGDYYKLSHVIGFDVIENEDKQTKLVSTLRDTLESTDEYKNLTFQIYSTAEERFDFYALYGGLFFLGLFLGALFIMATVLIIYYKQISEGYEDKQRFYIMQQVGMSKVEVRKSIRSQVLTVFFLPLISAIVHIIFAFKMITMMLELLNLTNVSLFVICTVATVIIFTVFYTAVYSLTARTYYKIVE